MPFYAGIAGLISYNGGSTGVSIAQVIAGFFCTYFQCTDISTVYLPQCSDRKAVCAKRRGTVGGPGSHCNAGSAEFYACSVGRKSRQWLFPGGNSCCNLLQPFWLIPGAGSSEVKGKRCNGILCDLSDRPFGDHISRSAVFIMN